jgi:hypothetical protein
MLYDHFNAIQNLNFVYVHLPADLAVINANDTFEVNIDIHADGFHIYLYASVEACAAKAIKIYPVVFNVGINEQSVASNL